MRNLPVICPRCRLWMVYCVENKGFKAWRYRMIGRTLYRCEECGCQGYIVEEGRVAKIAWLAIAIAAVILLGAIMRDL